MRQLLPVGADLVLAFDDEDAVVAQHPPRLAPRLRGRGPAPPGASARRRSAGRGLTARGIGAPQRRMAAQARRASPPWRAAALPCRAGRAPPRRRCRPRRAGRGNPCRWRGRSPAAGSARAAPAARTRPAIGDVGDHRAGRHVQRQDLREQLGIAAGMGREHRVRGGDAGLDTPLLVGRWTPPPAGSGGLRPFRLAQRAAPPAGKARISACQRAPDRGAGDPIRRAIAASPRSAAACSRRAGSRARRTAPGASVRNCASSRVKPPSRAAPPDAPAPPWRRRAPG